MDKMDPNNFNDRMAELSLSMDKVIPRFTGRPKRNTVISKDEVMDVAIDVNMTKSSQDFLRLIK